MSVLVTKTTPKFLVATRPLILEELEEDTYIIALNGIYGFCKHPLFRAFYSHTEFDLPIDGLAMMEESCVPDFGVPETVLSIATHFFEEVFKGNQSEAFLLMYFNPTTMDWTLDCVSQHATSEGCECCETDIKQTDTNGYVLVGSIRSNAFYSAIQLSDSLDETLSFTGLHIAIGNFDNSEGYRTIACEIKTPVTTFEVEPEDLFSIDILDIEGDVWFEQELLPKVEFDYKLWLKKIYALPENKVDPTLMKESRQIHRTAFQPKEETKNFLQSVEIPANLNGWNGLVEAK